MRANYGYWENWTKLVLGVWLFISPWFLGMAAEAQAANFYLIGVAIVAMAMVALVRSLAWEGWVTLALAIWLFLSPWLTGYADHNLMMWNAVLVALVLAGVTVSALPRSQHRMQAA